MSKLADLIEAHQTGRMKVVPSSFSMVDVKDELNEILSIHKETVAEYHLGVNFGTKGFARHPSEVIMLKDMCKRQIIEEVFGEFRPLIRRIERFINAMDFHAARTALRELENEMGL